MALKSKFRRPSTYGVKFRPPNVFLSDKEILQPLIHTNRAQLGEAARMLDGSSFLVKVLDEAPQSVPGGHMVMAKFKAVRPKEAQVEETTPFKADGKVTGRILGELEGIQVTAKVHRAKRTGRDRIWFQIRQRDGKKWRVSATMSYARALDVQFERD
jgi:hypothetical protein